VFGGFPDEHRDFFEAVRRDTTWDAVSARSGQPRRAIYGPLCELADELSAEFGPVKVYRLHRSPNLWIEQWAYAEAVDTIAFGLVS